MKLIKKIKVQSQSEKDKKYLVQIYEDGSAICECPYWQFKSHGDPNFLCKHGRRALQYLKEQNATK